MFRRTVVAAIAATMLAGCGDARQLDPQGQPPAPTTATVATPARSSLTAPTHPAGEVDERFAALDSAVSGVATAPRGHYVVTDDSRTLQRIDSATGRIEVSVQVPKSKGPLRGVIHDPGRVAVWLWSDNSYGGGQPNVLTEYDAATLVERRHFDLAGPVQDAAVWRDELWFAAGEKLFVLAAEAPDPLEVELPDSGLQPGAGPYDIEIDAAGRTVYVVRFATGYIAVDRQSRKVRATRSYPSKISALALTRSGHLWTSTLGGPDEGATLQRLDPATLEVVGASQATPPGPTGWSNLVAGDSVVYVEHCCSDGGQPALSCIDGATGRVLQTWTTYTDRPGQDWGRGIAPTTDGLFVYKRVFTRSPACPG